MPREEPSEVDQICVIRHAESFLNLSPPPDLPPEELDRLTATGKKRAARLSIRLPRRIGAVWTSPLGRAREPRRSSYPVALQSWSTSSQRRRAMSAAKSELFGRRSSSESSTKPGMSQGHWSSSRTRTWQRPSSVTWTQRSASRRQRSRRDPCAAFQRPRALSSRKPLPIGGPSVR
ncbi:MAG: hypothetical protein HC923_07440 [Myxococcales bacterium]|nr:hypothetical protein [Myxococcales bacterium]